MALFPGEEGAVGALLAFARRTLAVALSLDPRCALAPESQGPGAEGAEGAGEPTSKVPGAAAAATAALFGSSEGQEWGEGAEGAEGAFVRLSLGAHPLLVPHLARLVHTVHAAPAAPAAVGAGTVANGLASAVAPSFREVGLPN